MICCSWWAGVLTAAPRPCWMGDSQRREESLNDPVIFSFLSHPALNSNEAKQIKKNKTKKQTNKKNKPKKPYQTDKGLRLVREEEYKSCTQLKTLFYCILIKVHKRPEPAGQGLRSGWMERRALPPGCPGYCCLHSAGWGCSFCDEKKQKHVIEKIRKSPQATRRGEKDTRARFLQSGLLQKWNEMLETAKPE